MKTSREVIWRMREAMAAKGMFMTTEIVPLLRLEGVDLSREQVYRIASGVPQRLSLDLLGALCKILDCTPNDLIQFREVKKATRKRAVGESESAASLRDLRPVPVDVVRPDYSAED